MFKTHFKYVAVSEDGSFHFWSAARQIRDNLIFSSLNRADRCMIKLSRTASIFWMQTPSVGMRSREREMELVAKVGK